LLVCVRTNLHLPKDISYFSYNIKQSIKNKEKILEKTIPAAPQNDIVWVLAGRAQKKKGNLATDFHR
jgi:hypothetical protein